MNYFWVGFEKRAEEKQAAFGIAALAHLAQNQVMKKALKSKRFGESVGKSFTGGLLGRTPSKVKEFFGHAASAATVPEMGILKSHAQDLGHELRHVLQSQGIKSMGRKDLEAIQHLLQGNVELAQKLSPQVSGLAQGVIAKSKLYTGVAPEAIKQLANDPNHPLISNIGKNLVQIPKNMADSVILPTKVAPATGTQLAGSAVGSTALGMVDPITGAMNLGKYVMSNPKSRSLLQKTPGLRQALQKSEDVMVKNPVNKAFQKGQQGKDLGKGYKFIRREVVNPLVASAEGTAQAVGGLSKAIPSSPVADMARSYIKGQR